MTKAIEALKSVFVNAAAQHEVVKTEALTKLETTEVVEERTALLKTAKRAQTHETYNAALAEMSDKALALLHAHKLDAQALAAQSRECKKRSIAMLEAVAHSTRVRDKALDALLQRLAAKSDASLTISQIQREMQHETATQASYFKTFAAFFKFAQYSASDKKVTFDYSNAFLKALIEVYNK